MLKEREDGEERPRRRGKTEIKRGRQNENKENRKKLINGMKDERKCGRNKCNK